MSCNHRYLQSGRVMDRAVPAAWCRLPGCLFAAGKELGKSHLSWSTGKRHRWGISPGRISIGKPSSLLLVIRDELMTLLPLHLPPRMKLRAVGSLEASLKSKTNQKQPCNTKRGNSIRQILSGIWRLRARSCFQLHSRMELEQLQLPCSSC